MLAKAELFQAGAQLNRQTKTYQRLAGLGTVVAGKRILEAETAVAEAEVAVQKVIQTLVNLGMPITYDEVLQTPADEFRQHHRRQARHQRDRCRGQYDGYPIVLLELLHLEPPELDSIGFHSLDRLVVYYWLHFLLLLITRRPRSLYRAFRFRANTTRN